MEKLVEILSAYELLNNIIPGATFIASVEKITEIHIQTGNIFFDLAICYFVGLAIGRIGSLVIKDCFEWKGILKPIPYADFVAAERKGKDVRRLQTIGNMYRTYIAVTLCLFLVAIIYILCMKAEIVPIDKSKFVGFCIIAIVCFLLTVIFSFAFIRQTDYLLKRVNVVNGQGIELSKEEQECIGGD